MLGNHSDLRDSVIEAHLLNLHRPQANTELRARILEEIEERKRQLRAGLLRVPHEWQEKLRAAVASDVRLRWDFEHECYVMDQWLEPPGMWHLVVVLKAYFDDSDVLTVLQLNEQSIDYIRRCDIRDKTAREWQEQKEREAAQRREANRKAADDQVAAAVDTLSPKQIQTVFEVERALHTGETIEFRGRDGEFIDRQIEAEKKGAPDLPRGQGMNPGMHPTVHRHKSERKTDR